MNCVKCGEHVDKSKEHFEIKDKSGHLFWHCACAGERSAPSILKDIADPAALMQAVWDYFKAEADYEAATMMEDHVAASKFRSDMEDALDRVRATMKGALDRVRAAMKGGE